MPLALTNRWEAHPIMLDGLTMIFEVARRPNAAFATPFGITTTDTSSRLLWCCCWSPSRMSVLVCPRPNSPDSQPMDAPASQLRADHLGVCRRRGVRYTSSGGRSAGTGSGERRSRSSSTRTSSGFPWLPYRPCPSHPSPQLAGCGSPPRGARSFGLGHHPECQGRQGPQRSLAPPRLSAS